MILDKRPTIGRNGNLLLVDIFHKNKQKDVTLQALTRKLIMRKIHLIFVLALLPFVMQARESIIPATDTKVFYEGRVLKEDGGASFDWSNTTVRLEFSGTSLKMECSSSKCDYFNVWIDREAVAASDAVLKFSERGWVTIAEKLPRGRHSVILQKRSEGGQGCTSIYSFSTDGSFSQASDPFTRHIEFIGDSYTCGFGTEASGTDQPFRVEEENGNLTYAAIIGRYFNAGIRTISHSGLGVARNYADGSKGVTMVKKYTQTFDVADSLKWDASADSFRPDLVVIYLGTNDFSRGAQPSLGLWCREYAKLLAEVRGNYPEVPVLCVASRINEMMGYYVKMAVERSGLEKVYWTDIQPDAHNSTSDMGASGHPNYSGHRKVASCVIPYVSTITGWEMPFKAVE